MIIAIDGPAASGKSTIAKLVSEKLGFLYIDSGAMYRAVTHQWLERTNAVRSSADAQILEEILSDFDLELKDNSRTVIVNDKDLSSAIRENIVSVNVSYIASFQLVREKLVELQREISQNHNVIMDGRDIATVVFPNAELKIFMSASAQVRAMRRKLELEKRNEKVDLDDLITQIENRDKEDSEREISPLKKADNAVEIVTDNYSIEELVDKVSDLVLKNIARND